jgi:hypothetical protein
LELTGLVLFATSNYLNNQSTFLPGLWKMCGISGLAAFTLDSFLGRIAEKESKRREELQDGEINRLQSESIESNAKIRALQTKAENTAEIAVNAAMQQAARPLSEEAKAIFIKLLSNYPDQKFDIRVGIENAEGFLFARKICDALQASKWIGCISSGPRLDVAPGVHPRSNGAMLAFSDLTLAMQKADIIFSNVAYIDWDIPEGVIEILIGDAPKSPPDRTIAYRLP